MMYFVEENPRAYQFDYDDIFHQEHRDEEVRLWQILSDDATRSYFNHREVVADE